MEPNSHRLWLERNYYNGDYKIPTDSVCCQRRPDILPPWFPTWFLLEKKKSVLIKRHGQFQDETEPCALWQP